VNKKVTAFEYTDNNLAESRDSQTVHGWCRGYPSSNRGGSHLTYQWGNRYGG